MVNVKNVILPDSIVAKKISGLMDSAKERITYYIRSLTRLKLEELSNGKTQLLAFFTMSSGLYKNENCSNGTEELKSRWRIDFLFEGILVSFSVHRQLKLLNKITYREY